MNNDYFVFFRSWFASEFPFVSLDVIDWIFCQSLLETGNFESRIFLENHNLFGMKYAKKRITNARDVSHGHAMYSGNTHSIYDYMYWCCSNGFLKSDFFNLDAFLAKFKTTSYNPVMDSYISSINKLYSKFFAK